MASKVRSETIDLTGESDVEQAENKTAKKRTRTEDEVERGNSVSTRFVLFKNMAPPTVLLDSVGSVLIRWQPLPGALGYHIRMKEDENQWRDLTRSNSCVLGSEVRKKNLDTGTAYQFGVRPVFPDLQDDWAWSDSSRVIKLNSETISMKRFIVSGKIFLKPVKEVFRDRDGNFLWAVDNFLEDEALKNLSDEMFSLPVVEQKPRSHDSQTATTRVSTRSLDTDLT